MASKSETARVLVDSEQGSILVEPETGRMFELNDTGVFIFRLLENSTSDAEIIRLMCDEFEVEEHEAAADLAFFRTNIQALFNPSCSSASG